MAETSVGTILREWRIRHGLTQEQAAAAAECSLSGWRNWEKDRGNIDAETISRLNHVYPGLWESLARARP